MFRRRSTRYAPYKKIPKRRYTPKLASAKSIKYVEREVAKLASDIEVKHAEYYSTANIAQLLAAQNPVGAISLTCLAVGTGPANMLGTEVAWKDFELTYHLTGAWDTATYAPYANNVRVLVFWMDYWGNQVAPPPINFFLDMYGASVPGDLLSYVKWTNRKQFKTLYDKTHYMTDKQSPTHSIVGNAKISLVGKKSLFSTNAVPALSNLESGAIFAYVLSDAGNVNVTPTVASMTFRLTYTDA